MSRQPPFPDDSIVDQREVLDGALAKYRELVRGVQIGEALVDIARLEIDFGGSNRRPGQPHYAV